MKVCVLASGSSGNCILVQAGSSAILVDAGLSARETERRMRLAGAAPENLRAICVSHEHDDHTAGLAVLQRRYGTPVYVNAGTLEGLRRNPKLADLQCRVFTNGSPFPENGFVIESFSVPHDAYDPVGFTIARDGARVGIVTDIGMPTNLVRERLRGCRALIVESNHDDDLLQQADRPWSLKQRIRGRQGHLSNEGAGALLCDVAGRDLEQVFLAHLSADCNRAELALRTARAALDGAGHTHVRVALTYPDRISETWSIV